jgi:phosphoglycerol transferase MdoB-like AlkP superfamily enzyme
MGTLSQWIHQHDFLLLVCALLLGSLFVLSWFRLWTKRTLIVWSGLAALAVVVLLGLRTPAATVSEVSGEPATANASTKTNTTNSAVATERELTFSSMEAIEAYLQRGEKPTLVEFYSDFGIG